MFPLRKVNMYIILLVYLGFCTWEDCRCRQIFWPLSAAMAAAGVLLKLVSDQAGFPELACALVPGALLLPLLFLPSPPLGMGDILVLWVLGIWTSLWHTVTVFCFALMMAGMYAGFLLLRKKAKKQDTLPFIPFLFLAQTILLFGDYG